MTHTNELAAARATAEHAGREILTLYHKFEAIADAPADISTEADHRSQEIILQHLNDAFPGDAFCAEEATPTLAQLRRSGPRLWIIDPIDGTRGFARKLGEFSIMVALVERGQIALGLVLEPARGRLTYAVRGEGCWQEDGKEVARRCHVSAINDWNTSTLVRSRSEKPAELRSLTLPARPEPTHIYTYSAGIKLALIARGEADLYTSGYHGFSAWDVCAGQILVEEAGGRVTDAKGRAITYPEDGGGAIDGLIASNGLLHEQALARRK